MTSKITLFSGLLGLYTANNAFGQFNAVIIVTLFYSHLFTLYHEPHLLLSINFLELLIIRKFSLLPTSMTSSPSKNTVTGPDGKLFIPLPTFIEEYEKPIIRKLCSKQFRTSEGTLENIPYHFIKKFYNYFLSFPDIKEKVLAGKDDISEDAITKLIICSEGKSMKGNPSIKCKNILTAILEGNMTYAEFMSLKIENMIDEGDSNSLY